MWSTTMRTIFTSACLSALLAVSSLVCAAPALAQNDSAVDKAVANVQIEKIVLQLLGSLDLNALSADLEQAAKNVAAGKPPQITQSPALQDMQAKLQKQLAVVGPDLVKTMLAVMGPLLTEMRQELSKELATQTAVNR
jgi:hypothetical protein